MDKPLIMVVDDSPESLNQVAEILKGRGFAVISVSDGKSALEILDQKNPSLILLNIMMPGEFNGFDVLYYARERSSIPIIMLMAYYNPAIIHKALEEGADDCIKKPFSTVELLARIQAKLRRARIKGVAV